MLYRVAMVSAYFGVILCLVEVALHVLVVYGLGRPQILRYEPVLGWENAPARRSQRVRGDGGHWSISVDDAGRRQVAAEVPRAARPHVVALGDSFTFGDSIDAADHFLRALQIRLAVNVHNLGVVGYATDQELLAFRRYQGPCDVLLLMIYTANDLRDNLSSFETGGVRYKPKMTFVENALVARPVPVPWLAWARSWSYVTMLGLTALYRIFPENPLFDPVAMDERRDDAIRLYLILVREILNEARRRDVQHTVLVLWSFRSSGSNDGLVARTRDATNGRAIVINLDDEYARRGENLGDLYFPASIDPGQHWNEQGHAVLAAILGDLLGGLMDRDDESWEPPGAREFPELHAPQKLPGERLVGPIRQ
jgi:hypothetical protein